MEHTIHLLSDDTLEAMRRELQTNSHTYADPRCEAVLGAVVAEQARRTI